MPMQQMLLGAGGGINYAVGQVVFDGDNVSQSWTVPDNVYSISVVCVGRGEPNSSASGDGGGLAWASNIPVTPGATLTYTTRAAHDKNNPPSGDSILSGPASGSQAAWSVTGPSSVNGTQSSTYFTGTPGASRGGNRGGNGAAPVYNQGFFNLTFLAGGGGAAGYSGQGGDADTSSYNNNAAGGGACCGYRGIGYSPFGTYGGARSGGGGGVGLLGQGTTGDWTDNQWVNQNNGWGGPGGSGGAKAVNGDTNVKTNGGLYGGGAGDGGSSLGSDADHEGAGGGIRIIWPGHERLYPSTRTADES